MLFLLRSLIHGPGILIDKPILLVGRDPECDVLLNSKKVSRRHCVLAQVNDQLVVRDLGSTNGTRVNGKRVTESRLEPGDQLQLGNFSYQVCVVSDDRTDPSKGATPRSRVEPPPAAAADPAVPPPSPDGTSDPG